VEDGVRDLGAPPRLDVGQQLEFPQVVGALVKSRIAFSRERQIATGLLRSPANDVPADRVRWSTSLASGLLDLVRLSSERAIQAVRYDCSFAKKREYPPALLVVAQAGVCRGRLSRPLLE
jgi:hypothetical protein